MDIDDESIALTSADTSKAISAHKAKTDTSEQLIHEEFRIAGNALTSKIEELIHQGHIRRIKIQNKEGYTLFAIPIERGAIDNGISSCGFREFSCVGVIGAMVDQPKVVVEWQFSCPITCLLGT